MQCSTKMLGKLTEIQQVCVLGYSIIALALVVFVQAKNVYPQLLLGRLFFSLGGAAVSTMVTALLPSMVAKAGPEGNRGEGSTASPTASGTHRSTGPDGCPSDQSHHALAPSISSELTITPARMLSGRAALPDPAPSKPTSTSRVAGWVGMAAGSGALLALVLFLPLPARFQKVGVQPARALQDSYYIVAGVAVVVSAFCFFGLRGLRGDEGKKPKHLFKVDREANSSKLLSLPYWRQFYRAFTLGFVNINVGLGYVGGFVARASSVGISLFVPLLVNAYFHRSGLCSSDDTGAIPPDRGLGDIKRHCPKAYVLAAELTGVSQLTALICAPFFGYLSSKTHNFNLPLLVAAIAGIVGYIVLAILPSPRPSGSDGSPIIFLTMVLIGISQIGSIVCSLGTLGDGVLQMDIKRSDSETQPAGNASRANDERARLLGAESANNSAEDLSHLKGSIAGMYSLYGGAGILLLTKLGGALFDTSSSGAPFYIMAAFNAILLATGIGCGIAKVQQKRKSTI